MGAKKKTATAGTTVTRPNAQRPAGIQQMGPRLYAQIRAALQELAAAH